MEAEKVTTPTERVESYRSHEREADDDDASSIRSEALGDHLPKGYFYSIGFLGATTVSGRR